MSGRRFRAHVGLQLPPGSKGPYVNAGDEVDEAALEGLNVDALVESKWLEPLAEKLSCDACANDPKASKAAKGKSYKDTLELRDHYAKDHPALAAPAE